MAKDIELTWKNKKGETVIERCLLLHEDDHVFLHGDGEQAPVTIISDNGVGNTIATLIKDQVFFEDKFGIFCLSPENVLNIKEL